MNRAAQIRCWEGKPRTPRDARGIVVPRVTLLIATVCSSSLLVGVSSPVISPVISPFSLQPIHNVVGQGLRHGLQEVDIAREQNPTSSVSHDPQNGWRCRFPSVLNRVVVQIEVAVRIQMAEDLGISRVCHYTTTHAVNHLTIRHTSRDPVNRKSLFVLCSSPRHLPPCRFRGLPLSQPHPSADLVPQRPRHITAPHTTPRRTRYPGGPATSPPPAPPPARHCTPARPHSP